MKITKAQLLRSTLLAALTVPGLAAAAMAQQTPAASQPAAEPEERDVVVITGSRITAPGYESSSPITSVGEQAIAQDQPVAIESLLRTLPSAVPAIGPNVNNGANGGGTIDLRGLGSNRALVLMD